MDTVVTFVGAFVVSLVIRCVLAWGAMLALGAAHSWSPQVPPLSYMATLWVTVALSLMLATFSSSD